MTNDFGIPILRYEEEENIVDQGTFITFLIKNFTVEEYFSRMKAGESPLDILESKGYLAGSVKRNLKLVGYEPTVAGRDAYLKDQVAKYYQRTA